MTDQEHIIALYGLVENLTHRVAKLEGIARTIRKGNDPRDTLKAVEAAYPTLGRLFANESDQPRSGGKRARPFLRKR